MNMSDALVFQIVYSGGSLGINRNYHLYIPSTELEPNLICISTPTIPAWRMPIVWIACSVWVKRGGKLSGFGVD